MTPLSWLRAKAKRKPAMAAGGYVAAPKPGDEPIVQGGCSWPIDLTKQPTLPQGTKIQMRGYSEMTAEERQQFLDDFAAAMARPARALGPGTPDRRA